MSDRTNTVTVALEALFIEQVGDSDGTTETNELLVCTIPPSVLLWQCSSQERPMKILSTLYHCCALMFTC